MSAPGSRATRDDLAARIASISPRACHHRFMSAASVGHLACASASCRLRERSIATSHLLRAVVGVTSTSDAPRSCRSRGPKPTLVRGAERCPSADLVAAANRGRAVGGRAIRLAPRSQRARDPREVRAANTTDWRPPAWDDHTISVHARDPRRDNRHQHDYGTPPSGPVDADAVSGVTACRIAAVGVPATTTAASAARGSANARGSRLQRRAHASGSVRNPGASAAPISTRHRGPVSVMLGRVSSRRRHADAHIRDDRATGASSPGPARLEVGAPQLAFETGSGAESRRRTTAASRSLMSPTLAPRRRYRLAIASSTVHDVPLNLNRAD